MAIVLDISLRQRTSFLAFNVVSAVSRGTFRFIRLTAAVRVEVDDVVCALHRIRLRLNARERSTLRVMAVGVCQSNVLNGS